MAIGPVVTRGYSGTNGTVALVITRGYSTGAPPSVVEDLQGGPRYGSERRRAVLQAQDEALITILVAVINDHQS